MISELTSAKYAAELAFVKRHLSELGFRSTLLDRSEDVPLPLLVSWIGLDDKGRDRHINFLFVPVADEDLESLQLLQFYTVIPCEWGEGRREDVQKLAGAINNVIGLGSTGIDPGGNLYYKYLYPKAKYEQLQERPFLETVQLFVFLLERFGDWLENVGAGRITLEEAREGLSSMSSELGKHAP